MGMTDKQIADMSNTYGNSPDSESTPAPSGMATIRGSLGMNDGKQNMNKFTDSIGGLLLSIKFIYNGLEGSFMDMMNNRTAYDPAEYLAVSAAGIISGRSTVSEKSVKSYFAGVSGEMNDLFTKAHLDAINTEFVPKSIEERVVHDVIYDYLIFPIMMWIIYNWYYKLFYPMAKCPEMKDYSGWYSMIFPGMITGAITMPLYEMDKGMYSVNQMFSRKFKTEYSWMFFSGTFLAVYYLWLKEIAKFDYPSFNPMVVALSVINVMILMFSDFLPKYPVSNIASGIFFFLIMMITISLSFVFVKLIYIFIMFYFIYYSFFVLPVELGSYDIFALLDIINKTNIQEQLPEDSWIGRVFKYMNNYIFTSPILIVFCFLTMCEMSAVSQLPDGSWLKMSASLMMVCMFIVAAFYSVFEFYLAFFQRKSEKNDPINMNNMSGIGVDDMSTDVFETVARSAANDSDPGRMFQKVMPAIAVFLSVVGIFMMVMIISNSIPKSSGSSLKPSTT